MLLTQKNLLLENAESTRLKFRKVRPSDKEAWMEFCSHPSSFDFLTFMKDGDPKIKCEAWFERVFHRYENRLGGMNALIDKASGALVGQCGLLVHTIDDKEELEIGYSIMPRFREKGYATEAAMKCRDHAFENNLSPSIISIIHPGNIKSAAVAVNNGMRIKKQAMYNNTLMNIFAITKEEWSRRAK